MDPIFKAQIGPEKLIVHDKQKWRKYLRSFELGADVEVIVRKPRETISDPDRMYYFKVVAGMISEETTHSKDVIHEAMKWKFARYTDKKTGLEMVNSVFSNKSEMDIKEKKVFIADVRNWANEFFNIQIPLPHKVDY